MKEIDDILEEINRGNYRHVNLTDKSVMIDTSLDPLLPYITKLEKLVATLEQCIGLVHEQLEDVEGSSDIDNRSLESAKKGIAETLEYIREIK